MFLHVVSFDVPYPANYGGVIVIFHQIKALHALGVKIILHCYQYGDRLPQPELHRICHEVHYYPRRRSLLHQLSPLPFIMRTRRSATLLERLCLDAHPILFEGMHTAALLGHPRLRERRKLLRMHNVEWQYYAGLTGLTDNFFERLYYRLESRKLRRVEPKVVRHADAILALSPADADYYRRLKAETYFLPAFHPQLKVAGLPGRGDYVLFHGKLSVPDNERAALWLIREVFADLNVPFKIAGQAPSARLRAAVAGHDHIALIENPDERTMDALVREAHINLLVSFQAAGIKLKLINALFCGRFCVVNAPMVAGSGLEGLCRVGGSAAEMRGVIEDLMKNPFEENDLAARRARLEMEYSNGENAAQLMKIIRGELIDRFEYRDPQTQSLVISVTPEQAL